MPLARRDQDQDHRSLERGRLASVLVGPEAQADRIQAAYQRYLHRPADPPGLASWLLQFQHGLSDPSLAANILGATEFFSRM